MEPNSLTAVTGLMGMAWVACDAAKRMASDLSVARERAGASVDEIAAAMGQQKSHTSEQLQAKRPINLFRLARAFELVEGLETAYLKARARRWRLTVLPAGEFSSLVDGVRVLVDEARQRREALERGDEARGA